MASLQKDNYQFLEHLIPGMNNLHPGDHRQFKAGKGTMFVDKELSLDVLYQSAAGPVLALSFVPGEGNRIEITIDQKHETAKAVVYDPAAGCSDAYNYDTHLNHILFEVEAGRYVIV